MVLVGLVLAGLFTKREWLPALFALSAIALLPIALVIVQHSTLYDGVRHLLFIYPVIVVLAAAGWTAALSRRDPLVRRITAVLLVLGLVNILTFDVRAIPINPPISTSSSADRRVRFRNTTWTIGETACCRRSRGAQKPRSSRASRW